MKKIFRIAKFVALILALAVILTACGDGKPKEMRDDTYDLGCRALTIIEKYNSADISKVECMSRLKEIENSLGKLKFSEEEERAKEKNLIVEVAVSSYYYEIVSCGDTYEKEKHLKECLGK